MERGLGAVAILFAIAHGLAEWWNHAMFGQFLPFFWMHLGADVLLLTAGIRAWRADGAAGLLCGAWGFTFSTVGFAMWTVFLRLLENRVPESTQGRFGVLALWVAVSGVAFAVSLGLSWRTTRSS